MVIKSKFLSVVVDFWEFFLQVLAIAEGLHDVYIVGKEAAVMHNSIMSNLSKVFFTVTLCSIAFPFLDQYEHLVPQFEYLVLDTQWQHWTCTFYVHMLFRLPLRIPL